MDDISSLVNSIVNQFIVKPTGGLLSQGINGFVFDIIGDEDIDLNSDITDHYTEDNISVQDHIALRPPKFTLVGFVGELKDVFSLSFDNLSSTIASLNLIGEYAQTFTTQAVQAYDALIGSATPSGTPLSQYPNIYQLYNEISTSATKQQNAYYYFVNLWQNRVLCNVETPWTVWTNMAIENVRILQRDDNKYISEFSVTFKQIRMVSSASFSVPTASNDQATQGVDSANTPEMSGRVDDMTTPTVLTGTYVGGQVPQNVGQQTVPNATDLIAQSFNLPTVSTLPTFPTLSLLPNF